MVQLTTFKCGGLCLGTAIHHQASDGIAATRFMSDWADATRDPTRPIPTPCLDRTSLRARSPPTVQFHHPEFDLREGPENQEPVSSTFLNVTPAQLAAIKAACGEKYTSFESMAAHIWRCTCLARGLVRPDEEIRLLTTADLRRRLSHTIPSDFVGNAISVTVAIAPAAEVAAGLPAERIREAIEKLEEEYLRSAVDYLELQEDKRRLASAVGNFTATDISVGSWNRLPLNEVDFRWGLPEFLGPAAFICPRQFLILSSPDGGVKVCCSMETEKMDSFVKLFHELLPAPAGCGK
ncbi:hypothetical protein KFK09_006180 [Dendrobium nobile]|uniref:Uncharacterized protein n=1 Tax=Dendrobium nobile TaxID=94219 RepID=A0A8T3BTS5_DENNO|nr:hypothetical protein KFK09_006180 [Dendrobium nobile]